MRLSSRPLPRLLTLLVLGGAIGVSGCDSDDMDDDAGVNSAGALGLAAL